MVKMKKLFVFLLLLLNLHVNAQPLSLNDWNHPYITKSVRYSNYTAVLNCQKKIPYYVFYNLYQSNFEPAGAKRKNKWKNYVPEEIKAVCGGDYATTRDYVKSGWDRGHLAPAGDFKANQFNENSTFSFANAAPQNRSLNRGHWDKLENFERQSAIQHNGITVITGVIASKENYIGHGVGVPDYFWKIILWKEPSGKINNLAFLASNVPSIPQQVNIKYLEHLSGFDFGF